MTSSLSRRCLFACVLGAGLVAAPAAAENVTIDRAVTFSQLDGGESDLDGKVDGIFTVDKLEIKGGGVLWLDVLDANIITFEDFKMKDDGSILSRPDLVEAPNLKIDSAKKIEITKDAVIEATGPDGGGWIFLCAAEDIKLKDRAVVSANASTAGRSGGFVQIQSSKHVNLEKATVLVSANGHHGGAVWLIACHRSGDAIKIKGRVEAIGTVGDGGSVEVDARLAGIKFEGNRINIEATGAANDGEIFVIAGTDVDPAVPPTMPPAITQLGAPSGTTCACGEGITPDNAGLSEKGSGSADFGDKD